ncbi:MAG: hypothetical protein ACON5K_02095 [Bacteroidia bacterium]
MRFFILSAVIVLSACNSPQKVLPFGGVNLELNSKFMGENHNLKEMPMNSQVLHKDSVKVIIENHENIKTLNMDSYAIRSIPIVKHFEFATPLIKIRSDEIIKNTKKNKKNNSEDTSDKLRGWMLLSYLIGLLSLLIYTYWGGYFFVIFSAISITAALVLSILVISINQSLWILLLQITGLLNLLFLPW